MKIFKGLITIVGSLEQSFFYISLNSLSGQIILLLMGAIGMVVSVKS